MKTSFTSIVCSAVLITSASAWAQPSRTPRPGAGGAASTPTQATTTTTRTTATTTAATPPPATTTTITTTAALPAANAQPSTGTSASVSTTTTTEPVPTRTSADGAMLAAAAPPHEEFPRFGRSTEHSVGARVWAFITPSWMVGLFTHVDDGWSGVLSISPGLEYVYRKGGLDVVVGLQYTSLAADPGYFHGRNEGDIATERVQSDLWVAYFNALFLWGHRFNDAFELQYGTGVGLGYVGGNLYRSQVYPGAGGGWQECAGQLNPNVSFCDRNNNHYATFDANGNVTSRFSEPRLTETNGHIPPVIPWISLPHLALHFRPHRYVDIRLDGGFALVGFYGGLGAHFVF